MNNNPMDGLNVGVGNIDVLKGTDVGVLRNKKDHDHSTYTSWKRRKKFAVRLQHVSAADMSCSGRSALWQCAMMKSWLKSSAVW